MIRLLQGDVGSGKTVVALLAMAEVVEAGRQAAMMAPTEVLARQHFDRMAPLAASVGLRIALMTGRDKAPERRGTLAALAAGETRHCRRHACAFSGRRRLRRPGPRGRGRAASLRRPPAARACRQGRSRRPPGDDGDADPALARAGLFRRHGRVGAARKAARATADRHTRHADRADRRGRGGTVARTFAGRASLLDLPAGRGKRDPRRRRRRGPCGRLAVDIRRCGRTDARPDGGPRQGRGDGAISARRQPRSWSRPRSSRSGWTCPRRRS